MYQAPISPASIDPIISRLRPRSVGEILDQAFRLYRKYFLTFIAIIAVVHVPLQLAIQIITAVFVGGYTGFLASEDFSSGSFSSSTNGLFAYAGVISVVLIILSLVYGLVQQLSQGALIAEVSNSHLDRPVSFRDGYRQMFSHFWALVGTILLQIGVGLLIALPIILIFFAAFASILGLAFSSLNSSSFGSGSSSSNAGGFAGLFCLLPLLAIPLGALAVFVFIRLTVIIPAVMIERLGPVQAMRRSWRLVQNYWWRTVALMLVLGILNYVVQAGPAAVVQAIVRIFVPRDFVMQQLVGGVVTTATTLLFIPIQLIAITLYYFDLRVRKEGYDLETALNQQFPAAPPPLPAWSGQSYGQPEVPANMPPPALGQEYYGYNYNPEQGASTRQMGSAGEAANLEGGEEPRAIYPGNETGA